MIGSTRNWPSLPTRYTDFKAIGTNKVVRLTALGTGRFTYKKYTSEDIREIKVLRLTALGTVRLYLQVIQI